MRTVVVVPGLAVPGCTDSPPLSEQVGDWRRTGALRMHRGFSSAIRVRLENVLPEVGAPVTIVHADAGRFVTLVSELAA